ncbi:MAG TPA: hypothetical protein VF818_09910 [Ktedonobacterales bacterium]
MDARATTPTSPRATDDTSTSAAPHADPSAPRPLDERLWQRFCEGESYSALARAFGLDRGTVARHIAAVHQTLQAERQADAQLALSRALAAQHALQRTAWATLQRLERTLDIALDSLLHPPPELLAAAPLPTIQQATTTACLLTVRHASAVRGLLATIQTANRELARLEGLAAHDAPARQPDRAADGEAGGAAEARDDQVFIYLRRSDDEAARRLEEWPTPPVDAATPRDAEDNISTPAAPTGPSDAATDPFAGLPEDDWYVAAAWPPDATPPPTPRTPPPPTSAFRAAPAFPYPSASAATAPRRATSPGGRRAGTSRSPWDSGWG